MSIIHKGIKITNDNYIDISRIENLVLKNIYRVGDIIMTTNVENPSVKYGGSWVSWGIGKVPVGIDVNQTEFNLVEKTGGEKTHVLSVAEMPSHTHNIGLSGGHNHNAFFKEHRIPKANYSGTSDYARKSNASYDTIGQVTVSDGAHTHILSNTGGSTAHNNLQPYITCYFWKKTL